jgi:hypothetical protein
MSTTPPTTAARLPWNSSLADGAEETGAVGQCAGVVPAPDHGIARGSTAAKSLLWHCPGGRAVLTRPPSALESKQLTSRSRSRSRRRRDRVDSPKEEATQPARHTARPYLCADWRCFVDGRSRPQQTGSRGTSPPTLGGTQAQHAQPERLSAADHHHAAPPTPRPRDAARLRGDLKLLSTRGYSGPSSRSGARAWRLRTAPVREKHRARRGSAHVGRPIDGPHLEGWDPSRRSEGVSHAR